MPIIMILGSVGFMIGTGGSAIVSKTLGEGKKEKANEYFSLLVYLCVVSGVILSVIGIIRLTAAKASLPTIAMMIFTSIYGVVDGVFVSNCVGSENFISLLYEK